MYLIKAFAIQKKGVIFRNTNGKALSKKLLVYIINLPTV
jgi:hypothetical protein